MTLARLVSSLHLFYRQLGSMSVREDALSNFRSIGTKIVCVGRNYKDHAIELGNVIPKKPLIFVKTLNSYVVEGEPIIIPQGCNNLHQEVELGVVIGKLAKNVKRENAFDFVAGYTVALDMTARDFQDEAKAAGAPWFLSKSFDSSCPVGHFIERSKIADPHNEELFCRINGIEKQRCKTNVMMFNIPSLIEYITQFVTLQPGDLLLTGTPKGVCSVHRGDKIEFGLEGKITATFTVC
ncbi:Uncharacterized protein Tcan_05944 [Toxocara canis]|uniref:Oxaloacetate tautomerase FAHD1, mitochondrial n=2 Tax=Toxocara canis TaxID=6265 RepID=A0A0B2VIW7_TOXCA|nr:Uncharacterized protein Tcan_05944 [Toxocara canis]VDM41235.1 unnamed protein product [Toxocara canis]